MSAAAQGAEATQRASAVRALFAAHDLAGVFVAGSDRFLNEYVPPDDSTRTWLSGFTGSTGDAFLGRDTGWVAADGRYTLQARDELAGTPFAPLNVPLGTSVWQALCQQVAAWAREQPQPPRLGYAPGRLSVRALSTLRSSLATKEGGSAAVLVGLPSLVEEARGALDDAPGGLRRVPDARGGGPLADKLRRVWEAIDAKTEGEALDAFALQALDEIAWLVGLRGDELPFQATFRSAALLRREGVELALPAPERVRGLSEVPAELRCVDAASHPSELAAALSLLKAGERVGYASASATAALIDEVEARGAVAVPQASPVAPLRALKAAGELQAMREAFAQADRVMEGAIAFVQGRLAASEPVTEVDLVEHITQSFRAHGAVGLSFRVIAAAGANGAHIHYGSPDPERPIQAGELVLIDTGGYFAEGYATDLTRTFLAGEGAPTPLQRERYTRVLQASIAGMAARLPLEARGEQLDALVRAPLWAAGLDYKHGTGHGVGVNVHEAPPRITTRAPGKLEPGQVFSIEPGVYVEGWGGIRIENLCTIEVAEEAEGFMDVVPLTFAALDERLIDRGLLQANELAWLERYAARRAEVLA